MIFPKHFEQKIEFDKVKLLIKGHCVGMHAKEIIDNLQFSCKLDEIMETASQTNEFCTICREESDAFPVEGYFDTRTYLKRIATEGTYLLESELFELYRSLLTIKRIVQFFGVKTEEEYPFLKKKCTVGANNIGHPAQFIHVSPALIKYICIKSAILLFLPNNRRRCEKYTTYSTPTLKLMSL